MVVILHDVSSGVTPAAPAESSAIPLAMCPTRLHCGLPVSHSTAVSPGDALCRPDLFTNTSAFRAGAKHRPIDPRNLIIVCAVGTCTRAFSDRKIYCRQVIRLEAAYHSPSFKSFGTRAFPCQLERC